MTVKHLLNSTDSWQRALARFSKTSLPGAQSIEIHFRVSRFVVSSPNRHFCYYSNNSRISQQSSANKNLAAKSFHVIR
jgi:hypothetical protein